MIFDCTLIACSHVNKSYLLFTAPMYAVWDEPHFKIVVDLAQIPSMSVKSAWDKEDQ